MKRGTGARGLRAIMEDLLGVMYELSSRKDVGKCVITRDVVLAGVNPTLVPRVEEEVLQCDSMMERWHCGSCNST